MKKALQTFLIISILSTSALKASTESDKGIQQTAIDTDSLWGPGTGAQEGSYTAVSLSMLGWGIGLAITIAVLSAILTDAK